MVDRTFGEAATHGETGMAGPDDHGGGAHRPIVCAQATRTVTLVGFVMMSNTAERFCDWATRASISSASASASMSKRDLDVVEAVAGVGIGAEDAEDVHRALDGGRDLPQLDAAILGDGGDAGGQAAAERREDDLDRRGATIFGGEDRGMVGVDRERGLVDVVLAEAGEALDRRAAVGAVHPRGGGAPGELGRFGCLAERVAGVEQGGAVDAVVDRVAGHGHVVASFCVVVLLCGVTEIDGQLGEAAQHEAVAVRPTQVVAGDGESKVRESPEQRGEGDASFEAGQWCAEAEVGAVPEAEVRLRRAADVEHLGVVADVRVVVRAAEADQDLLAGGDHDAVELDGLGRDAERGVRDRCRVADELLDRCRHPLRFVRQQLQLVGVVEQGDDAVADEARRGVGAGNDELEEARQELLFGQPLVVVARRDEHTDEVVARRFAVRRHQVLEVGNDRVRRSDGLRRRRTAPRLEQGPEPAVQRFLVGQRDAEQLADHPERQRMGEALDQIDDGVRPRGLELVEQLVDDAHDRRVRARRSASERRLGRRAARKRAWSSPSTASMCRANAGPGRPSSTTSGSSSSAARKSFENRVSRSAWRAAS